MSQTACVALQEARLEAVEQAIKLQKKRTLMIHHHHVRSGEEVRGRLHRVEHQLTERAITNSGRKIVNDSEAQISEPDARRESICVGCEVKLCGLREQFTAKNGLRGKVTAWNADVKKWKVESSNGQSVLMSSGFLRLISPAEAFTDTRPTVSKHITPQALHAGIKRMADDQSGIATEAEIQEGSETHATSHLDRPIAPH